jgi:hypothetical protein
MRIQLYVYEREFTVRDDAGNTKIMSKAKAVASVEMAVSPTMVAGELSVEISEGETSGDDFSDGDYTIRLKRNSSQAQSQREALFKLASERVLLVRVDYTDIDE